MSKRRADVVDLSRLRIGRLPPATRFILEARDAGRCGDDFVFQWRWSTEDTGAEGQWRPTNQHIGAQLRRIADRLDPRPVVPVRRTRHRVRIRR